MVSPSEFFFSGVYAQTWCLRPPAGAGYYSAAWRRLVDAQRRSSAHRLAERRDEDLEGQRQELEAALQHQARYETAVGLFAVRPAYSAARHHRTRTPTSRVRRRREQLPLRR